MPRRNVCVSQSLLSVPTSLFTLIVVMVMAAFAGTPLVAQTAQFMALQSVLSTDVSHPYSVASDGSGNFYVADYASDGDIYKYARQADGSYARSVIFSGSFLASSVASDAAGNLYIVDTASAKVYKETLTGGSYTQSVMNNGASSPAIVAVDGSGNVYVTDSGSTNLFIETLSGGSYTESSIDIGTSSAGGIAVDATGNIFISNVTTGEIVKETPSGGSYTATAVVSGIGDPEAITIDRNGNLYIADGSSGSVLKETLSGGSYTQSVLANGFSHPKGLALDGSGNFVVADLLSNHVDLLQAGAISFGSAVVGGPSNSVGFFYSFPTSGDVPTPVVVTQGATGLDFQNYGWSSCSEDGVSTVCTVVVLFQPLFPGQRKGAVVLKSSSGTVLATALLYGTGNGAQAAFNAPLTPVAVGGGFSFPKSVATDSSGNVYVADTGTNTVKEIAPGCTSSTCVTTLGGGFNSPEDVAVDGAGNVYVADLGSDTVKKIPSGCTSSSCVTTLGGTFASDESVAVDGSGNLYVANTGGNTVVELPYGCGSSACAMTLGGGFSHPTGVAVDGGGNVYVADASHNAVKEIPSGCTSSTCVLTLGGGFSLPEGVAVDGSGNVYVADTAHSLAKEIPAGCTSSSCVITLSSGFDVPYGLAADSSGNVYVADTDHNAVKKLDRADGPTVNFAALTAVGSTDSTDGPKTVILQNIGNQALTFPAPTVGGAFNPSLSSSDFSYISPCPQLSTTSAPFMLDPGGLCTATVNFTPETAGTINGSVVFTDNSGNPNSTATHTVSLSGTAIAPPVVTAFFSPSSVKRGGTATTTMTVTVTNPNSFPLTGLSLSNTYQVGFAKDAPISITCGSGGSIFTDASSHWTFSGVTLAAGASCSVVATGHAELAGVIVDTTTTATSNEAGAGAAASATLVANPVSIGTSTVGSPTISTVTLALTTGGTIVAPVVLTQGATGLDFKDAETGSCTTGQTYNAGDVCTVHVTFTPTAPGVRSGAVELKDAAGNVLATVFFSGIGQGSLLAYAPATQTVADSSVTLPLAEAMDAAGNLYVADLGAYSVVKVPNESGTLNPAHQSTLSTGTRFPVGIAVDGAGNVYYPDILTATIVRIPAGGGAETTVGGSFTAPYAIAVDMLGNVYVADGVHSNSANIDVIAPGSNSHTLLTTVGVNVSNGASLAFDGAGNLYLASSQNSSSDSPHGSVIKIPNESGVLNGGAQSTLITTLATPGGMIFDAAGNLYVTVQGSNPSVELVPNVAGALDFTQAVNQGSGFSGPTSVVMDGLGTLYVADPGDAKIYKMDRAHSAVNFTSTTIGQSTATQTVSIGNIGNVSLQLTGAPVQTDADDFTIAPAVANGCDTSGVNPLNAGLACYLSVSFNPQTAIAATNVLTIASNAVNTAPSATLLPATLTMTGTGLAAVASIGTTTITQSYGNTSSGTATVTGVSGLVTPTGTLSYSIDSGTATDVTLSSGQAALSIPSLTGGAHTLSLTYGGDTNYTAITTPVVVHFTTTQASTTVAGSAVTQSYGATPTSTITVTGFLGAASPTGTVSYSIDSGATTSLTLTSGAASLDIPGTLVPGPHSIALSYSGDTNYSGSTGSINFTTTTATLTVTAANASKVYGTENPTLTASYTGQQNGDTFEYIVGTSAIAITPVGPYEIIVSSVTGVHSSYYSINLVPGTLTISKAATTVVLAQTAPVTTGVGTGVNTTFTATVLDASPGSTGTPTGSVEFFDGSTSLGTSVITLGTGMITTSFSTVATHVITAQYLGDGNFNTVTSTGFNEVVVTPGFNVVANPNALTIVHGESGSAALTFTPFGNYQGSLALSCSGLPPFSSCLFTPASITFTGNNVAQTSQVQIYTLNAHTVAGGSAAGFIWLPGGVLACILALRRRSFGRALRVCIMLIVAGLMLAGMTGCGSNASFITTIGSDTVTITAVGTSGANTITQTATIAVTITP